MKRFFFLVVLLVFVFGCSPWKHALTPQGGSSEAIQNAIQDFVHTSNLTKKDSAFKVRISHVSDDLIVVGISGAVNPVFIYDEMSIGSLYPDFPSKYLEHEGKLFYWTDSTQVLTNELITVMNRYNQIDSLAADQVIPDMIIDDAKKGVDYYFCKSNLLNYRKVKTNVAVGWYDPPSLDCSSN